MIKLETYKGFDIFYENILPFTYPTYKARITCIDNEGEFKLLYFINPDFQPMLTADEASKLKSNIEYVLRRVGIEKAREKIDLQEFEYNKEYDDTNKIIKSVDIRRFLQEI